VCLADRSLLLSPFRFVFEAETFAYAGYGNATSGGLIASTGFIQWGHRGALGVFDCTVAAYHVDYKFLPPNVYTVLRKELAPLNQTKYMSYGLPVADDITNVVRGTGFDDTTMSFADAAALEISRQTVAYSSTLYDQQEALEILGQPAVGSRLPFGPFVTLVLLTVALA
jgi:prepilin signal peptidase PulO-like enzyme (type II secretory pathway)